MEEDWDLEAIVRGFTSDDHYMSSAFVEAKSDDYNQVADDSFSSQASFATCYSSNAKHLELELEETKMKKNVKSSTLKYKKRKNQHKTVVLQPQGQSSDSWAWRKYGQKPIKGSPYPRSYYKCSSSKGCLARKQVEQSCSDPGMLIITYNSAEHTHTKPTRRSSLAGTNRNKFTAHKITSTASLTTPLWSSEMKNDKDDLVIDEKRGTTEISNENEYSIVSDDFFVGLEDLDRLISESGFYGFPYPYQTNY